MEIKILDGSIKTSDAQHAYIMDKVGAATARLQDVACTVDVRLTDLNGPKGGIDKHVSIAVTPPGHSLLRVEETAVDYYTAIDAASATMKRLLTKTLERAKANGPRAA